MSILHFEYINKFGILKRAPYDLHDASDLHASRIAEFVIGGLVRRVEKTGNFLLWNGHCWEERDNLTPLFDRLSDTIKAHIVDIRRRKATERLTFFQEFAKWRNTTETDPDKLSDTLDGLLENEDAIYKKFTAASSRNQIMGMLGSRLIVKPDQLDQNTDKLVFQNGCYDCVTGEFDANDKEQIATLCIQRNYEEPNEEAVKTFQDYLESLGFDEETLDYLQRSFGYAATGRGSEKRFWWFRGITDTSKSTLIDIVANCLDQYAVTTMSDQWCTMKQQGGGHTEELARLRARRLVTADEFKKNSRFNEALLKKITAGTGMISASRKGEKTIDFRITFAMFFSSNFDCQMSEDDTAFLNRLNTVTFEKQISSELKDTQFVNKFLAKGQNRMAVLKWVMDGAKKYCAEGIGKDPVHVKASRTEFLEQQISISEQLGEIIEINSGATGKKSVTLSAVLGALSQLQKSTRQHTSFSKKEVANAITALFGVELTKGNGFAGFPGLTLKNDYVAKPRRSFDPYIDFGYREEDAESN